jgi:hypothetical protein
MDLVAQVGIDLYENAGKKPFERVTHLRKKLEDAGLVRVEFNRALLLDVACRAALSAARAAPASERAHYLDAARKDAHLLANERAPWARALGAPKRAAILALEGRDASSAVARAIDDLRSAQLHVYAAACAHAAKLESKDGTSDLYARAQVKRPEAFARVFFPGW